MSYSVVVDAGGCAGMKPSTVRIYDAVARSSRNNNRHLYRRQHHRVGRRLPA